MEGQDIKYKKCFGISRHGILRINFQKKQSIEESLKKGYQANYQEALDMAKDFEASYGDGLDD